MWQMLEGGLRSLKASEFEKWGLEPSRLTEVYVYASTSTEVVFWGVVRLHAR